MAATFAGVGPHSRSRAVVGGPARPEELICTRAELQGGVMTKGLGSPQDSRCVGYVMSLLSRHRFPTSVHSLVYGSLSMQSYWPWWVFRLHVEPEHGHFLQKLCMFQYVPAWKHHWGILGQISAGVASTWTSVCLMLKFRWLVQFPLVGWQADSATQFATQPAAARDISAAD